MILASNRNPVAQGLTSTNGSFRLEVRTGTILRILRIGYLPLEKPLNELVTSPLAISIVRAGRMIAAVSVRSNPVCPRRSDQREALALWSAATDALLAMVVAAGDSQHTGLMTQILYDRLMYPNRTGIQRQTARRVITGNVLPIRAARNPEQFIRNGYVVPRDSGVTYYAPDPEVLLDSSFAATHCLSLRSAPRGDTTRIGIAFAPPRDRRIPDIEGVLWLNRNPLSLQSLEFEYRGVSQALINVRAGGHLQFETFADGVPIISSWYVRSPRLGHLPNGRPVAVEVHQAGGLIADGVLRDGSSWSAPLATVRGRVISTVNDQPVPDVVLSLDSTDQRVTTDRAGQFVIDQLLPGPYVLRIRDSIALPLLRVDEDLNMIPDSSAIRQWATRTATTPLNVQIGSTPFVELALPWREPLLGCGIQTDPRRFTVMGIVVRAGSAPVPNVPVRLTWTETVRGVVLETSVDAHADDHGRFVVCGIPSDRTLASRVVDPAGAIHSGTTRITRAGRDVLQRRLLPGWMRAVTLRLSVR
jgi:hypothetical protein